MTIIVTADLHLNNLSRDKYRHDFQKELRALVKEYGVCICFILGDLTDEKDFHSAQLVNKVVDHIHRLAQLTTVIILKGNHDYTAVSQVPFFAFLKRIEGVHWIGEPTLGKDLKNLPTDATEAVANMLFLPHSPNPTRDWASISLKGYDLILAHNTFDGAEGDSGRILSGTPINIFPKDARVLSGDVHVPQTIGPVTYVGSPYRIDFGDSYEPRVVLVDGSRILSIPCEGPRKQLIEVKAGELIKLHNKKVLDDLEPGDILKIRVELESGQYAHWSEFKEKIKEWAHKYGYIPHLIQPVVNRVGMSRKAVARQAPKSDAELLKSFAKHQNLDEKTTNVGLDLLNVS